MASYPNVETRPWRLTLGSFRTLGVLKVASWVALAVVVVKALGNVLAASLGEKEGRRLDLAAKGREPRRREAMVKDDLGIRGELNRNDVDGMLQKKKSSTLCLLRGIRVGRFPTA